MSGLVLGIETSCDETAASVVERGRVVRSSVVSSQIDLHRDFGGVVPELAGRAHLELIQPVIDQALAEAGVAAGGIEAVACTVGPGLIGSLLVGVAAAKATALVWDVPFVGVNHLEGHLYASLLEAPDLAPPLVVLLVSGGHTMLVHLVDHGCYRVMGSTIDDAAGEAFDKVARFLGLGYPGGPVIDRLAAEGNPKAVRFPRGLEGDPRHLYDFSFSGLKTSVMRYLRLNHDASVVDICASFQEAVVDTLLKKSLLAAGEVGATGLCLAGGVAANRQLRARWVKACEATGLASYVPGMEMCTDNAAMIAAAGWWQLQRQGPTPLDAGANPNLRLVVAD